MKRSFFVLLGAVAMLASTGCGNGSGLFPVHQNSGCNSSACGDGSCGVAQSGAGMAGDGYCGNGACNGDPSGMAGQCALPRGVGGECVGAAGPATGAVAYPYYTNRGPRDFLLNNPPSIGP
jgi:hypothetical protein